MLSDDELADMIASPKVGEGAALPAGAPPSDAPVDDAAFAQLLLDTPQKTGALESVARGLLDGATFGFDSHVGLQDRDARERSRADNPWSHFIGEIAGGVVPAVALGPVGAAARIAGFARSGTGAASLASAARTGAAQGAGYGALSGAGHTEELTDVSQLISGIAKGGAAGAVIGGGLGAGLHGVAGRGRPPAPASAIPDDEFASAIASQEKVGQSYLLSGDRSVQPPPAPAGPIDGFLPGPGKTPAAPVTVSSLETVVDDIRVPSTPPAEAPALPVEPVPPVAGSVTTESAEAALPRAPVSLGKPAGDEARIVTPDGGMEIAAQPVLVELSELTSAKGSLQPRDRSRAEYTVGVRERAARLDPEQLKPGRVSDSGAPVVGDDGTILSGNGRSMSIAEAYRDPALKARADAYRASLGPDAADMKEPVLVMRASGLTGDDAVKFADLSNRGRIAAMSSTERAMRDARAIGDDIALYTGGEFTSAVNAPFMRSFMEKASTSGEAASMSRNGELTQEGVQRMRNAVLAAAYDDAPVLARMVESSDDNIRNITGALTDVAPSFAKLRADAKAGHVMPELDATPQIIEAVRIIGDLRSRQVPVSQYLAQKDAFDTLDPVTESWIRAFHGDDMKRAISREKMADVLKAYAEEAAKHRPGGLIEDTTTATDVLSVARRSNQNAKTDIGGRSQDLVESIPDRGREARGRGDAPRGEAPGRSRAEKLLEVARS